MKDKLFFAILFLFAAIRLHAQTLERQVIGSAGIYQTAAWGSLSSTTGESVTNTFTTSSLILTQGFQQPLQSDVRVYDIVGDNISVTVFPNPAADIINVVVHSNVAGKHYYVTLFDLLGQHLDLPKRDMSAGLETKLQFDVSALANAPYLMQIKDEHSLVVKTVKFSKIN